MEDSATTEARKLLTLIEGDYAFSLKEKLYTLIISVAIISLGGYLLFSPFANLYNYKIFVFLISVSLAVFMFVSMLTKYLFGQNEIICDSPVSFLQWKIETDFVIKYEFVSTQSGYNYLSLYTEDGMRTINCPKSLGKKILILFKGE